MSITLYLALKAISSAGQGSGHQGEKVLVPPSRHVQTSFQDLLGNIAGEKLLLIRFCRLRSALREGRQAAVQKF